jgi:hypothetical protein
MADVTVTLGARDTGLQAALTRAQGAANAFKATFANMAAPLAALGGLAAGFAAVKSSLDFGGQLSDLSARTGVAVGQLVILQQAFKNAGLSEENVRNGINKLQRSMEQAADGSKSIVLAFSKLGLSLSNLQSLTPDEQFKKVGAAIAALPDPAQRASLAMEIFGRSGAEMLTVFSDGKGGFDKAAQQVGGLAQTIEENANAFDSLSDSFNAVGLKGQQLSAGFTAALVPALEKIAAALDEADLTSLGKNLGAIAAAAINLGTALSGMIPQILGVTAAFLAFRSGFSANVLTSIARIGPVSAGAFAQVRVSMASINFASFAAAGRAAFTSIAVSARAAAVAIRSALVATGIGAIITGITLAIDALISRIAAAGAAIDSLNDSISDSVSTARQLYDEIDNISTASDKVSFGKRLEEEIERSRKKIEELQANTELDAADRDMGISGLQSQIASLDRLRAAAENLTPEVLAQRQAEKDRAAALAESERRAASLNAELGKSKENLDKKIADSAFSELDSGTQKQTTLDSVGAASTEQLDAEIAALAAKRESAFLIAAEAERLDALINARSKLVDIEKQINSERERAAEQAARDAEREESERRIAQEKEASNAALREALSLELKIAEARASQNAGEEARLKYVKDYKDALEKAQNAGMGDNAFEFAKRFADAQFANRQKDELGGTLTQPQATNQPLFASSLAKIGGGGGIAGAPALLDESRKQTLFLKRIAEGITRLGPQPMLA